MKRVYLVSFKVVKEYLKVAADFDNVFQNTKYNIAQMIPSRCESIAIEKDTVTIPQLGNAKDGRQLYALWGLESYYLERQKEFHAKTTIQLSERNIEGDTSDPIAEAAFPALKYDDSFLIKRDLFCSICNLQLSSEKDAEVHAKGKRHKRKVRIKQSSVFTAPLTKGTAEFSTEKMMKRQKCDAPDICVKG